MSSAYGKRLPFFYVREQNNLCFRKKTSKYVFLFELRPNTCHNLRSRRFLEPLRQKQLANYRGTFLQRRGASHQSLVAQANITKAPTVPATSTVFRSCERDCGDVRVLLSIFKFSANDSSHLSCCVCRTAPRIACRVHA